MQRSVREDTSALRVFFFFQAEDGIRDLTVTGVQTCALPISEWRVSSATTASHEASTSRARSVMSPRFPIGVATTNRGTLRPRVERILEMRQDRKSVV